MEPKKDKLEETIALKLQLAGERVKSAQRAAELEQQRFQASVDAVRVKYQLEGKMLTKLDVDAGTVEYVPTDSEKPEEDINEEKSE